MYFSSIHKDVQRRGVYMEEQTKYFVLKQKAVPEVLLKVVEAKKLIESERAITIQEATEKVGSAEVPSISTKTIFSRFTTTQREKQSRWGCRWTTSRGCGRIFFTP